MATMASLRNRGLIRAFGVSNVGTEDIRACLAGDSASDHRPVLIQNRFNLLEPADDDKGVMAACQGAGLAYTCYSPLAGGLLGGAYTYAPTVPEGTRLTLRPDLYAHLWTAQTCARIDALKAVAEAWGRPLAGLAVWWLVHHPMVGAVMLGARTPRQLEDLVREAVDFPFDDALFTAAAQAARCDP